MRYPQPPQPPAARGRSGEAAPGSPWARLARTNERAHELAVDLRRDGGCVDAGAGEELPRVLHSVDARGLDVDALEAGLGELVAVLVLLEGAGHAADPELDALADGRRHLAAHDHVGHGETAAGLEHAKGFRQHAILVAREIDHAIRDDDIYAGPGQGNLFDLTFQELYVVNAGLALIVPGERQHLVRHVESVGLARRPHAPGGEEHVDAAARAQVEHRLAHLQLGQRGGIAAA